MQDGSAAALAGLIGLGEAIQGRRRFALGAVGVRDPDGECEAFDGRGYDGSGNCKSDGHYLCVECSELSPEAPRFVEYGRAGRADRLRLYLARPRYESQSSGKDGGTDGE